MQEKPKNKHLPKSSPNPSHSTITTEEIFTDFKMRTQQNQSSSTLATSVSSVLKNYRQWLTNKNLSASSIKNYLSDTRIFLGWLKRLPQSSEDILDYATQLKLTHKPKTVKRKVASLKKFCLFLHQVFSLEKISHNITHLPHEPIELILKNFRAHLVKHGHKPKTVTNYISDIRHFLNWSTTQPTNN